MVPNDLKIRINIIILNAVVGWSIYLLTCTQLVLRHARGNIHGCNFNPNLRAVCVHPCHYRRQYLI